MASSESSVDFDLQMVPKVNPGLDMNAMVLSPEEGLMFSRVDGRTPLEDLVRGSGLSPGKALEVLNNLKAKGVVSWDGESQSEASSESEEKPPWPENFVFDPFELAEDVELEQSTKKKMLYLHKMMDELTHYDFLEVGSRADAKEIKRAYFRISREFHPDSYFRKNLGSYRSKIEALFKRVGRAYEVLSSPQKREEYDATLPYEPEPEELERQKIADERKKRDQKLAEERKKRLLKRSPIGARKAKARKHYQDAVAYKNEKETVKAANSVKLALTLDPDNQTYKDLLEEVGPKAAEIRADKEFRRGQMEESMGRYEEALNAYIMAIDNCPTEIRALGRAAGIMLELRKDLRQALAYARKAAELEPDNYKLLLPLAEIYIAMDMKKNAIRELTRYVKLNPIDDRAGEILKELKKSSKT